MPEEVAGSDWEPWSEPYEIAGGSQITSPSPRKLLKIRATLHSDDPEAHATLREVRINFSEPVADRLLGRLVPTRVDLPGVERASRFSSISNRRPIRSTNACCARRQA